MTDTEGCSKHTFRYVYMENSDRFETRVRDFSKLQRMWRFLPIGREAKEDSCGHRDND